MTTPTITTTMTKSFIYVFLWQIQILHNYHLAANIILLYVNRLFMYVVYDHIGCARMHYVQHKCFFICLSIENGPAPSYYTECLRHI